MKILISHFGCILLLLSFVTHAQYLGGDGDGSDISFSPAGPAGDQSAYCSGGDGDGFDLTYSFTGPAADQSAYCSGGDGDGFDLTYSYTGPAADQSAYCSGGDGDGFDLTYSYTGPAADQSAYCSGGDGDGFDLTYSFTGTLADQGAYCSGGDGDGFDLTYSYTGALADQSAYCSGGDGDGFDLTYSFTGALADQSAYCSGGDGDGFTIEYALPTYFGIGIWTGLTNTEWNTNTNWIHDIVPGISNSVLIPTGCLYYPDLNLSLGIDTSSGWVQCRSLDIEDGASLNHSSSLFVNGPMNVAGAYTGTLSINNSHEILGGGQLSILSSGSVIIGNQSIAPAISDMVIFDGGVVWVDGGYLEIDDKLWIKSGGSLTMTAGEISVHNYGTGSAITSLNPGYFYVEAGSLGQISGGTFRLCGYDNDSPPHNPPYSFVINEPDFDFSGTSTLHIQHGDDPNHHNMSLYAVDGVSFQNIIIDKSNRTVFFRSDVDIKGSLTIETNSALELESGSTVSVGP